MGKSFDSAKAWDRRHSGYLTSQEAVKNAELVIQERATEWDLRDLKGWDIFTEDEATLTSMEKEPYKKYSWLQIAIYKFAQAVAMSPFQIYRGEEEVENHAAVELFRYVSPWLSRFELFQALTIFMKLKGEAFIVFPETVGGSMGKGPKIPRSMMVPEPVYMHHKVGEEGITGWVYKHPKREAVPVDVENVIHFKEFNPYLQYRGMSRIDCLKLGMRIDFKAAQYNDAFFDNYAVPEGLVTVPPEIGAEEFQMVKDSWRARHEGRQRSHRIGFAYGGVDFKAIGVSQKDMEFLESRRYAREEILALLEVPKGLLSITDDLNYATLLGLKRSFWEEGIIPFQTKIEEKLDTDFFEKRAPDVRGRFDRSNIPALKEDMTEKVKSAKVMFDMGWGINQINERLELGMDEVPWGDTGYLPIGLVAAGSERKEKPEKEEGKEEETKLIEMDFPRSNFPDRSIRDRIWDIFNNRAKPIETKFQAKFTTWLWDQRRRILALLNPEGRDVGSVKGFDWRVEGDKLVDITIPMLEKAMTEGGEFGVTLIGQGSFDVGHPEAIAWLERKKPKIRHICDRIKKRIIGQINEGVEKGETIGQIADRVKGEYNMTKNRALTIARTETGGAFNAAEEMSFRENGVEEKEWLTAKFGVRDSHDNMDGQIKSVNEKFITDAGHALMHPGDPEGPPEEIINCRCSMLPVVDRGVPEGVVEYKEAKSIDEAQRFCMENMKAEYVSFRGIDLKLANVVNRRLTELIKEFPKLRGSFGYIGDNDFFYRKYKISRRPRYVAAVRSPSEIEGKGIFGDLLFDTKVHHLKGKGYWTSHETLKGQTKDWYEDNILSQPKIEGLIDHEVGHQVMNILRFKNYGLWREIGTFFHRHHWIRKDIIEVINRHADADDQYEFWAELFSSFQYKKALPTEYKKLVTDVIKSVR